MRNFRWKPILLISFGLILVLVAELATRATWNEKDGRPGLILGHPRRIEVLAPNYTGYFAGQSLHTNNLGFRDDRDYSISKGPHTFRILVLGDSITFGHGVSFGETWTYQLEQRLKGWKPGVDWQVWNLGFPGYNAVTELRTLEDLGPEYKPDLVIVGFSPSSIFGLDFDHRPSSAAWVYSVKGFFKKNFYLYAKARQIFGRLTGKMVGDELQAEREANLLLRSKLADPVMSEADLARFPMKHKLKGAAHAPAPLSKYFPAAPEFKNTQKAIARFKEYEVEGKYKIVFFLNMGPDRSKDDVSFINGPNNAMNSFFVTLLSGPTSVVSPFDAFWSYQPAEVPGSSGHSLAAANKVKSDVLFDALVGEIGNWSTLKTR